MIDLLRHLLSNDCGERDALLAALAADWPTLYAFLCVRIKGSA